MITYDRNKKVVAVVTGSSSGIGFETSLMLAREWVGDPEKRDSPLYNLKKNYGYDINRNSGFNKKWWEIIRDNIVERTAEWIVGVIIGVIMLLIGNFLSGKG
jgi:hypothetical protein